jgi:hypothetical protein
MPTAFGTGGISLRRRKMFFAWTPQRIRIAIYFAAAYLALC